ncbi:MAG: glucuronate isomerase [Firmicutes bacterium]|nr:glucuronate isomerase [Bacillota bacterium]
MITDKQTLREVVLREVNNVKITDIHTHIYAEDFGELLLWGIDELVTYHYLIAEYFRYSKMDYAEFFALSKKEQADLIWQKLFIEHSPVSEAQRGVLTVLAELGLDVASRDINAYREYFASLSTSEYIDKVFEVSGVKNVVMTNDPFDPNEKPVWDTVGNNDPRFKAALRVDPLLNDYATSYKKLQEWGYDVSPDLDAKSIDEVKRFLSDWITKMDALYLAVSLPPTFTVPENSLRSRIVENCVIPVCREHNIPFAMMIGVNKLVNYKLGLAGDSVGKADISTVEYLCKTYPENKFMVTFLSKENQHEAAITARKFGNLMLFGCWWYLNNPSIIDEITRLRMETLGLSFIPQHSDARVLDQLIYKWSHSRKIIAEILIDKYNDILDAKWAISEEEIRRDVEGLFSNNFWNFIERTE